MKIIHSFWTKPSFDRNANGLDNRQSGGWLDKKYLYISWALSCLSLKKHYGHVELFTDVHGKKLLIDILNLPYDHVSIALEDLSDYPSEMWAVAKLYTYQLQREPFLHVDSDVFVWKRLPKIEDSLLVVQNEEHNFEFYQRFWKDVVKNFQYVPSYMVNDFHKYGQIKSCNAGIFGGTDVDHINAFAQEAFDFIHRNKDCLHKVESLAGIAVIYEQYLFACYSRSLDKEITCLFDHTHENYSELSDFFAVTKGRPYVHTIGDRKKNTLTCSNMEAQLLQEYPAQYYHIDKLLRDNVLV